MKTSSAIHQICIVAVTLGLLIASCAHDTYRQRADTIKDHVEAFYGHLKANRVEAAIHENEQIETMASQAGDTSKKQAQQTGPSRVAREFELMKTAKETAGQNWLALAQYFAVKKQYAQARTTYRRIIDTYTAPTDKTIQEQASRGFRNLDLVDPPAPHP